MAALKSTAKPSTKKSMFTTVPFPDYYCRDVVKYVCGEPGDGVLLSTQDRRVRVMLATRQHRSILFTN
jgi:hypothetical protein